MLRELFFLNGERYAIAMAYPTEQAANGGIFSFSLPQNHLSMSGFAAAVFTLYFFPQSLYFFFRQLCKTIFWVYRHFFCYKYL